MERVISGIRPTGNLHLGNYFGAVKSFVKMQDEYDCMFFIADWHSLTTHPTPENIRKSVKTILSEYLACGIDPEKAPIYVQSDVKQVLELYLYLNMNAYLGELERVTSFKEKVRKQPDNVNAGLLTYPCLMAADILMHKADKVPVGKDQEQNMEMARLFARRFNRIYNVEYFKEPASFHFADKAVKVPGLDGTGKRGKSEGNCLYLCDDEKTVTKKIMRAVTDSGPTQLNQEKPEVIQNLFLLCELLCGLRMRIHFLRLFASVFTHIRPTMRYWTRLCDRAQRRQQHVPKRPSKKYGKSLASERSKTLILLNS